MRIVTAYILPPLGLQNRVTEYFERFTYLVRTGLPITAFIDRALEVEAKLLFPSVDWVPCAFTDLPLASTLLLPPTLPENRNKDKDTAGYLVVQNSKTFFLNWVAERYGAQRLAWVDFGVAHVLNTPNETLERLHFVDLLPPGIHIPGCYEVRPTRHIHSVDWRFCGGLVVVDRKRIRAFHAACGQLITAVLPFFTWEVNVWAAVDLQYPDLITWHKGDHNDTLFDFLAPPEREGGDRVRSPRRQASLVSPLS